MGAPMAKVFQLRSSDGKVLFAPSWDERPSTAQALPLETGVPSRALERVIQVWTKHALAPATGESKEALSRWDADFARRLAQDGLTSEVAAAVKQLRLKGVRLGPCRPAGYSASRPRAAPAPPSDVPATARPDPATAAHPDVAATAAPAAGADDPVRIWCRPRVIHARADPAASPDRAAASRARGRQWTQEEESACHHRKRPVSSNARSPPGPRAPAAAPMKKVPATLQLHPSKAAASSLRFRRGLPELSCKCPQQNPLLGALRKTRT